MVENRKLYIADWHYAHGNILAFDGRPFSSVEEMNAELVRRWNEAVKPGDTIYVLGDMFWCKADDAIPVLKVLNGNKILIRGNHDRIGDSQFDKCFAAIKEYLEVKDGNRKVILCHYPIFAFKNHYYDGYYHLYGHVHNTWEERICDDIREVMARRGTPCMMKNCGAMMPWIDYTPRTLDEIFGTESGDVGKYSGSESAAPQ